MEILADNDQFPESSDLDFENGLNKDAIRKLQ